MSAQIREERRAYYDILAWLEWLLACMNRAIGGAESALAAVLRRASFWEQAAGLSLNERQRHVLNLLLGDFAGKLTSSKWARLCKCSADTALRDIHELVRQNLLQKEAGGGRSTSYSLVQEGMA